MSNFVLDGFEDDYLQTALAMVEKNLSNGTYKPLPEPYSSVIREHYRQKAVLPKPELLLLTKSGTVIAYGYVRLVVGDYGAYLEIAPDQMHMDAIEPKFGAVPFRDVKYIWHVSKDSSRTKVYEQKKIVEYADYKVGMFYVSPDDVV